MEIQHAKGTGIAYRVFGSPEDPCVVCLHGFPDTPRTWGPLANALVARGRRVITPWLPGYAPSSLTGPLDPLSVADRLLAFIEEVSPGAPVHLVGHDWGAVCAYPMLYQRPELFRSAAVLAIPHLGAIEANMPEDPRQFLRSSYIALFQFPALPERLLRARDYALVERLWKIWSPGFNPGDDYFAELKRCLGQSASAPLAYYRALRSPSLIRRLRALVAGDPIPVPTLYLHGERDGCMAVSLGAGQEKYFSAMFDTVRLAEAGHFLHLERPAEVNEAIAEWQTAHAGEAARQD
ncbi:MAG: alpha/beta hydrolase [Myxococcota bacterium]